MNYGANYYDASEAGAEAGFPQSAEAGEAKERAAGGAWRVPGPYGRGARRLVRCRRPALPGFAGPVVIVGSHERPGRFEEEEDPIHSAPGKWEERARLVRLFLSLVEKAFNLIGKMRGKK